MAHSVTIGVSLSVHGVGGDQYMKKDHQLYQFF